MTATNTASPQGKTLPKQVRDVIRARKQARQARERLQLELASKEDLWHNTIASKLDSLQLPQWQPCFVAGQDPERDEPTGWKRLHPWLDNFLACGTQEILRVCSCCGSTHKHKLACSQKFCPRCQWKLNKRRVQLITAWTKRIREPKHLVLTQRNFEVLTKSKLKRHVQALGKLRRQKVFANVAGGSVSVEVTNESRGWHLHSHWLVDSPWVDAPELARAWGKLVGQEYAIVKVKDVTAKDYVGELSKYVAKGNDIAKWEPDQIWQFITSIRGRRFFMTFGSLSKCAAEVRAQLARENPTARACECGSCDFVYRLASPV